MNELISRIMSSVGLRLVASSRIRRNGELLGCVEVGGHEVKILELLGSPFNPGVTKAGSLSFRGRCCGHEVKIYSARSAQQAALRRAIQAVGSTACKFPEVVASDDRLIVEEWVAGVSASRVSGTRLDSVREAVASFLFEMKNSPALVELSEKHRGAFCYLEDYLLVRAKVWENWPPFLEFIDEWRRGYEKNQRALPYRISHPDLSADNVLLENGSDNVFVIDNELLGVGPGWILDGMNSLLHGSGQYFRSDITVEEDIDPDFLKKTWLLRQIGKAFDSGDIRMAAMLVSSMGAA